MTPEHTDDGRYVVVDGRRWRATDPAIPEDRAAELRSVLMAWRRAVKDARGTDRERGVRDGVQAAKVALGERGEPWWEQTDAGRRDRLAAVMRTLLRHRDPDATICPSDAARVVGGDGWRELMTAARGVADELRADGVVAIRQAGEEQDSATVRGPIRIARGANFPAHEPDAGG